MLATLLLPDAEKLHLLEEIRLETGKVVLNVMATQKSACCPKCKAAAVRVHSQYQ